MNVTCPTCRRVTQWEGNDFRPFCSERCKLVDLGKWASEKYRIPLETGKGEDSSRGEEESQQNHENGSSQG